MCNCPPHPDRRGDSYSRLDHEKGTVSGYTVCPCGKEEKLVFTQDYRPQPKSYGGEK